MLGLSCACPSLTHLEILMPVVLAQWTQNGASVAIDRRKSQVKRWRKHPECGGGIISRDFSRTVPRQTPASIDQHGKIFERTTAKGRGKRVYRIIRAWNAFIEVSTCRLLPYWYPTPSCRLAGPEASRTIPLTFPWALTARGIIGVLEWKGL